MYFTNYCKDLEDNIDDVDGLIINELRENNLLLNNNIEIKKNESSYFIICQASELFEKLLKVKFEKFKLRSIKDSLNGNK